MTTALIDIATRLREVIPHGLQMGKGTGVPGSLCIESAIAWAAGEPHRDTPSCVAARDREVGYSLNDAEWSSNHVRATALLPLGLASLGSAGCDRAAWTRAVMLGMINRIVPIALRNAVWVWASTDLLAHADKCASATTLEEGRAASRAAARAVYGTAAYAAAGHAAIDAAAARTARTAVYAAAGYAAAAHTTSIGVRDFILSTAVEVVLDAYRTHPHPGMLPPEEWTATP